MEPSKKAPQEGRTETAHEPSKKEREAIRKKSGPETADLEHAGNEDAGKKTIY